MKIVLKYYNNFNKIVRSNQWNTCICDISNTIHTFYIVHIPSTLSMLPLWQETQFSGSMHVLL